jgi:co-chaperonin GroES (HSP10)
MVIFKKYGPDEIQIPENGKEVTYFIMEESDILGILEDE